jgi:hypothetical protein
MLAKVVFRATPQMLPLSVLRADKDLLKAARPPEWLFFREKNSIKITYAFDLNNRLVDMTKT